MEETDNNDADALTDNDREWAAEAVRRRDEVRSGQVQAISGEEVLAEVRRLVGRD